jgi:hypothetical protein
MGQKRLKSNPALFNGALCSSKGSQGGRQEGDSLPLLPAFVAVQRTEVEVKKMQGRPKDIDFRSATQRKTSKKSTFDERQSLMKKRIVSTAIRFVFDFVRQL